MFKSNKFVAYQDIRSLGSLDVAGVPVELVELV